MYSNMLISAMLQNNIDISDYEDSSKPVVEVAFQKIRHDRNIHNRFENKPIQTIKNQHTYNNDGISIQPAFHNQRKLRMSTATIIAPTIPKKPIPPPPPALEPAICLAPFSIAPDSNVHERSSGQLFRMLLKIIVHVLYILHVQTAIFVVQIIAGAGAVRTGRQYNSHCEHKCDKQSCLEMLHFPTLLMFLVLRSLSIVTVCSFPMLSIGDF